MIRHDFSKINPNIFYLFPVDIKKDFMLINNINFLIDFYGVFIEDEESPTLLEVVRDCFLKVDEKIFLTSGEGNGPIIELEKNDVIYDIFYEYEYAKGECLKDLSEVHGVLIWSESYSYLQYLIGGSSDISIVSINDENKCYIDFLKGIIYNRDLINQEAERIGMKEDDSVFQKYNFMSSY